MKSIIAAVCVLLLSATSAFAEWRPADWADTSTLEFLTDCPDEGEKWSPVWLVVLDGEMYISLGSKAASRLACSRTAPKTSIKIEGELYEDVTLVPETALAQAIEDARWDKYWTNVLVGYFHHDHYRLDYTPN